MYVKGRPYDEAVKVAQTQHGVFFVDEYILEGLTANIDLTKKAYM